MSEVLTYEKALKKLSDITSKLEKGNLSLQDSLDLFEEGTKLAAACYAKLSDAQQKVTRLTANNETEVYDDD